MVADGSHQAETLPRCAVGPEGLRLILTGGFLFPLHKNHMEFLGNIHPDLLIITIWSGLSRTFSVGPEYHLEDKFYIPLSCYRNIFYKHGT